nr:HupE/UreJ family protein [uncultured Dongia sp.]
MTRTLTRLAAPAALTLPALTLLATPAFAHTGLHGFGFAAGLSHPFSGLDHMLVMAGIGIWAAQLGGRNLWLVPVAFVGTMLLGAGLALVGSPLPQVELGIAGSVIAIGLLISLGTKLPSAAASALVALMALFHGHAHGTELPAMASAWGYAAGFVLSTAMLHVIGLGLGFVTFKYTRPAVLKIVGLLTMMAGGAMVAGL